MCQSDLDLSPDQYMTVVDAMLISNRLSPPNLPAMSTTRDPQMPLLPTTIVSPGSSRFAMHASMPASAHACTIVGECANPRPSFSLPAIDRAEASRNTAGSEAAVQREKNARAGLHACMDAPPCPELLMSSVYLLLVWNT